MGRYPAEGFAHLAPSYEVSTLAHGTRVVTTPIPTTQAVAVALFVGVGSRSESPELNGITHFLEHMVFKGTERRPDANMIAEAIEGAGGSLNAYTNKEFTCYYNMVPFDRHETAIDVTCDMLLNSLLEQEEIERERTVVQQELKRTHDNPSAWAARLIGQAVYGDQPCGRDVGGTVELVATWQRPDFVGHIEQWYRGPNVVLSVAGNVTHEQVMELAEPMLADMPNGLAEPLSVTPYAPEVTGARVSSDSREIDQCSLQLGVPSFGRDDPDRFALRVMNDVLGSGMSSRLFREVRERRGLAYGVGSGFGYLADTGSFTISAGVDRDKIVETIEVCVAEAGKMTSETVPGDELRKAKDHTIGRFRLSLETAFSLGQRHGEQLLTRGSIEDVDDYVDGLEAVTADDVKRVASRILTRDRLHVSAVGPDIDDDELANAIGA
jgi:predicted Zn-dependent peptidase